MARLLVVVKEKILMKVDSENGRIEIPIEPYKWYLELRKYGTFPHSGFGLGIERTLSWICGIHHVRETIPLPRLLEKIYP